MCLNLNNEKIEIQAPTVDLKPYEIAEKIEEHFSPEKINYTSQTINNTDEEIYDRDELYAKVIKEMDLTGLDNEEKESKETLVYEFAEEFYVKGRKFTCTPLIEHKIEVSSNEPIRFKTFSLL